MWFLDELGLGRLQTGPGLPNPLEQTDLEVLKTRVFDYWGRYLEPTLERIKGEPGETAYVWGGEVPLNPSRFVSHLILGGFDKVIMLDQFSHLLGRDNMFSTKLILDRPALSVYRRSFLLSALWDFSLILRNLRPLIEASLVELLPPPVFWTSDAVSAIEVSTDQDLTQERYTDVFRQGLTYGEQGKTVRLQGPAVLERFKKFCRETKTPSYCRTVDYMQPSEEQLFYRGPAEELNEALFGGGVLAAGEGNVTLVTDLPRHWIWLEWKLGQAPAPPFPIQRVWPQLHRQYTPRELGSGVP